MWSLLVTAATASPPNETVRLFEVDDGGGYVERMQLSDDGSVVVGRTRDSLVGFLMNADTWEEAAPGGNGIGSFVGPDDGCDVAAITTAPGAQPRHLKVWVACVDGRLLGYDYAGSGLPVADGGEVQVDTRLDGLWYDDGSHALFAFAAEQGAQGRLHWVDPNTLAVDPAGKNHPKTTVADGFQEGVLLRQSATPTLVISHGGSKMSHLAVGSGTNLFLTNNITGGGFGCSDLCEAPNNEVFCVDPSGLISRYQLTTQRFVGLGLTLDAPRGVGTSLDPNDAWLVVTGNQVNVWQMDGTTVLNPSAPYFQSPPDADNPIQDILTTDGYMFGGGEAGYLHVVTQNPWVYPGQIRIVQVLGDTTAPATVFSSGDVVRVSFVVNKPGTFEVAVGGDRPWDGGRVVASGPLQATQQQSGGETVTVYRGEADVEIDGAFDEGVGNVWIRAESQLGDQGHGAAQITVDNPPRRPGLTLGFGDGLLTAQIEGIPDADLDHYTVWISDEPFAPQDYPTGGPTGFRAGRKVAAEPGADPSITLGGLENGVAYYVAARAYDAKGAESQMSAVQSEVPLDVFPVSQQVGDPGGSPCSTGATAPGWGLAALAAAWLRRRRRWAAAALLLPGIAAAADDDPWWKQDTTKETGNFEVRYGVIDLLDPALNEGYAANAHNLLMIEVGPQIYRYVEVDVGTGFFQELDFQRTAGGVASDQRQMLTWYPFQLDATLRGHFVDEQPAVPFVRYGWDYVIWSEKYDRRPGGPKDVTHGAKFGTHYALGVNLLLDLLQPGRASFLETRTGINDSWLTIEWRRQRIDGRDRPWSGRDDQLNAAGPRPLDFSGDAFTLGLKLDW